MSNFGYCIRQGFKNIFKNRTFSLASIGTIMSCLFLFGLFFSLLMNFRGLIQTLETSVSVTVFFKDGVTEQRILEIRDTVALRDEVNSVTYVDEDSAWEAFKTQYFPDGDEGVLTNLDEDNPLAGMGSLSISLKDSSRQRDLVDFLQSIEDVSKVNALDSLASSFTSISRLVSYVSLTLILILVLVAIFLISNTVMMSITARKEEIAIMKYIGATDTFVRGPYLVESLIIGLIGSIIPMAVLYVVYDRVISFVEEQFPVVKNIMKFSSVNEVFTLLLPISLAIGLGIGLIGSSMTLHKHVRV